MAGNCTMFQPRFSKRHSTLVSVFLLVINLISVESALAAPAVTGKLKDQLQTDGDSDGKVDRGDKVRYEAIIDNTAGADPAQNVIFNASTVSSTTTLDAASIKVTPIAINDQYLAIRNSTLSVNVADGLLKNDFDPKDANPPTNAGMTVTAASITSAQGGSVVINANGSFTYTPVANFSGNDSFTYTAVDADAMTNTATVSLVVSAIWFVDSNAAAGGNGSQAQPYNSISALNGVGGAGDVDAPGETIYFVNGTYPGTLELEANQTIIGAGSALEVSGVTVLPAGTRPTYTGSIKLANGVTIKGMAFAPASGVAITGSGASGGTITESTMTLATSTGAISLTNHTGAFSYTGALGGTSTGTTLNLNGGSPAVTITGNIAQTGGRLLDIQNTTGGSVNINGTLTSTNGSAIRIQNTTGGASYQFGGLTVTGATANAIHLASNPGATYTFNGDVNVTTASGVGIFADSGTLALSNAASFNNVITTTGGAALDLSGVAVSGSLDSLTSNNSAAEGIDLDNVTGSLTVLGNIGVTGATGTAIDISGGSAVFNFSGGTTTLNSRKSIGINVNASSLGNLSFATVNIGTINSGTGVGINIQNTTNSVTFGAVSVADSGASAITLNGTAGVGFNSINIGSGGSVSGSGVDISGNHTGTIALGTGNITNTTNSSLKVSGANTNITYSGSITQVFNAALFEATGHTSGNVTLATGTLSAGNGNGLQFNNADGIYSFNGPVTLNGGDAGVDIFSGSAGQFTFANTTITSPTGTAFSVQSSNPTINYNGGSIKQANNARGLHITSSTSGVKTFAVGMDFDSQSSKAIELNGNTGSTTTITGAIDIDNTAGIGIDAINAGILNISNADVVTTTGTAVNITGTTSNSTFANINVSAGTAVGANFTTNTGTTTINKINITNTGATGFNASSAGTLTISGATNSINTTNGIALDLNAMTISGSNVIFNSITSIAGTNGVDIDGVTGGSVNLGTLDIDNSTATGIDIANSSSIFLATNAVVDGTAQAGIHLTGANGAVTFSSVNIDGTTGAGIQVTNNTNVVNINGGAIGSTNDPAGNAFDVSGGSANISMGAAITNATNRAVEVTGRTAGTVTISGNINETGTGLNIASNTGGTTTLSGTTKTINTTTNTAVNLSGNSGHIINFSSGGLDIDTTSGSGFNATGGGTIAVTGANNTINSTTGTALNVASTTIGGSHLAFRSISSNGATNGIVLNSTGTSGGLTVTGDGGSTTVGGNNSGGQLLNSTSTAILLNNARHISLRDMRINNSTLHHIDATTVTNLTLNEMNLDTAGVGATGQGALQGSSVTNLTLNNSTINAGGNSANEHGVSITNLLGSSTVDNSRFTNSATIQFRVHNTTTSSAPDVINFTRNTFNLHTGTFFGDNLSVEAAGTSNIDLNIGDGTVGNRNTFDTGQDGVQALSSSTGRLDVSINNNIRTNGTGTGFNVGAFNGSTIIFDINNNQVTNTGSTGVNANSANTTNAASMTGHIRNNTITRVGRGGTGFYISNVVEGAGNGIFNIQGNTASGGTGNPNINGDSGIRVQGRDPSNNGNLSMNVTINNNQVSDTGFRGIDIESGSSAGGTGEVICLNMLNNNSTTDPVSGAPGYRLRHRASTTFNLQNFAGSGANAANITTWINTTKSNTGTTSISGTGFSTSAACTTVP